MPARTVALIGAGTVARAVADRVAAGAVPGLTLLGFHTRTPASDLPAPQLARIDDITGATRRVAEVVERYPQTTNVAAAVALAGIGFEATRARVVADPALSANVALLTARGSFGELSLQLANVASTNPRTSAVVAHSVVATLRRLTAPVVVPG